MRSRSFFGLLFIGTMLSLGAACAAVGSEAEESVGSAAQMQAARPEPPSRAMKSSTDSAIQGSGLVAQGGPAIQSSGLAAHKPALDAPALTIVGSTQTSIDVQVCAGASGAPAGFSVQWMTLTAYAAGGWNSDDPDYCAGSFSGVPAASTFSLGAFGCSTVSIGDLDPGAIGLSFNGGCNGGLTCDTWYAFRAFAHGDSTHLRSPFSATVSGSTAACDDGCTLTQGYWATHDGSPVANAWPVSGLSLGSVSYSEAQLSSILDQPVAGNGLVSMSQQLIAAKLNIASGAGSSAISSTIQSADALIGGLVVPPIGDGYLAPADTSALTAALTSYNEGTIGPGHCE